MQTATGFECFEKALTAAQKGTSYNPVITIAGVQYTFYKPTLGDIEEVTKRVIDINTAHGIDVNKVIHAGTELFSDIHMKMELKDTQNTNAPLKRAVQKQDLDKLENQAHVNLFRNVYVSLCIFFILRSDGYTITF